MKNNLATFVSPTNHVVHAAVNKRVLDLVKPAYDFRGRFSRLEEDSGVAAHSWQNFYYGKQRVNEDMLAFALRKFPKHQEWILHGEGLEAEASGSGVPSIKRDEKEAVSNRVREFLVVQYPEWGRIPALVTDSGINEGQWTNFLYGKQHVNKGMLAFVFEKFPEKKNWLLTGLRAFESRPSRFDVATLDGRFLWMVKEWAAPKGEGIFRFLAERSNKFGLSISAEEWAACLFGSTRPTLPMIQMVLAAHPGYAQWLMLGKVSQKQVSPGG